MPLTKKESAALIFLIILLIAINYSWLDSKLTGFITQENYETINITRVTSTKNPMSNIILGIFITSLFC